MLKRIPVLPTIVVLIAVGIMIRLGFWQIDRMHQKEALLARYAANLSLPQIEFNAESSDALLLFRKATYLCRTPKSYKSEGAGKNGTRFIVQCSDGGFVQIGTSLNPQSAHYWQGGIVSGTIAGLPEHRTWLDVLLHPTPIRLMLVAQPQIAGLQTNNPPDMNEISNNHLSYAIQWFLFAATALVIYALALRKRLNSSPERGGGPA